MNTLRDLDERRVVATAEAALTRAMGEGVRIADVEALSDAQRRNLILRGTAVAGGGAGRSVIIKATRSPDYDPAAEAGFAQSGLIREWAATAFLSARAPTAGLAPTMLAGDAAAGVLVFEDLGTGLGLLVGPLLGNSPEAAEHALVAYAAALGRLHAGSIACADEHALVLQTAFPAIRRRKSPHRVRLEKITAEIGGRLGGTLPDDELDQIARRLDEPGAWLGLVHGDPCPDNALIVGDGVRLIDFEFAAPGHTLLDAVYWRIGFPTCWCAGRVPEAIADRAEAAYRAAISGVIDVDEASFRSEAAFIAASWLLSSFAWRLDDGLKDDGNWGIASIRSRLLWWLEAVIDMTETADILPGLRATARRWLAELQQRWPESRPLGFYPAFTTSA